MSSKIHQFSSYLKYWLQAVDVHSLHAPFIFNLYISVFKPSEYLPFFSHIEAIRSNLIRSGEQIKVIDFGAGSQVADSTTRKISQIAGNGITRAKYSQLLYRLIDYMNAENIVELGTSLGINTLYLSSGNNSNLKVNTFEGDPELSKIAQSIFKGEQKTNINLITGEIDMTLPAFTECEPKVDLAFFDANHQLEATLNYFQLLSTCAHKHTCFIFDDIHWSKEMEQAWNQIRKNEMVTLSIDIFQFGLIFFNEDLRKQHYILEF